MAGRKSRSKGQRGEREVVKILQAVVDDVHDWLALPRPTVERNQNQTFEGGCDLVGTPGLAVEVKFQEQLAPELWWRQAEAQAATLPGHEPVLFYRRSRTVWRVRVRATLDGVNCVVEFADLGDATNYLRQRVLAALA